MLAVLSLAPTALAQETMPTDASGAASPVSAAEHAGSEYGLALTFAIFACAITALVVLWRRDVVRPGSFSRANGRVRAMPIVPWFLHVAIAFCAFLLMNLAVLAIVAAMGVREGDPPSRLLPASVGGYAASIAVSLYGLRMIRTLGGDPGAGEDGWPRLERGLDRGLARTLREGALGVLALVPLSLAAGLLTTFAYVLITHRQPDPIAHDTLKTFLDHRTEAWAWGAVGIAVVLAPIAEELMFRGLVQSGLVKMFGARWPGILVASLAFAGVHLGSGVSMEDAYALIPIFVVGVSCGVAMERTGRVGVPILMHAGFNAFNVVLALVQH
jgi:membrane protease YdiL (CAAX protease family)